MACFTVNTSRYFEGETFNCSLEHANNLIPTRFFWSG
nr:MAG TPA: hypothetical protein [Caudoviricetes sp.]